MTRALIELYNGTERLFSGELGSDGYPSHAGNLIVKLLKDVKTSEHIQEFIPLLKFCDEFAYTMNGGGYDYNYQIDISKSPFHIQVFSYSGNEEYNCSLGEFASLI